MNIKKLLKELFEQKLLLEGRIEDAKKKYPQFSDAIFNFYTKEDPSGNQKYLNWLLSTTIKDSKYELGNPKVYHDDMINAIIFFHRNQQKFTKKDINQYKDLISLEKSIVEVEEKIKEKKLKKQRDIIYKDDRWLVISPKTYEASCAYGAGTKWCVTMKDTSTHWNTYSKNASFFFILDKHKTDENNLYKVAFRRVGRGEKFELWDAKDSEFSKLRLGETYINELPKKMLEKIESYHRVNFPKGEGRPKWIDDDPRAQALHNSIGDDYLEDHDDTQYGIPIYQTDDGYYQVATSEELDEAMWSYYDDYSTSDLIEYYDGDGNYMELLDEDNFIDTEVSSYIDNVGYDDDEWVSEADKDDELAELKSELEELHDEPFNDKNETKEEEILYKISAIVEESKEIVTERERDNWKDCLRYGVVECLVRDKGFYSNAWELWDSGIVDYDREGLVDSLASDGDWEHITGGYGYEEEMDDDGHYWYVYQIEY